MKRRPGPTDEPDDIRMTIGEHLDELRRVVVKSLMAIVIACLVCIWPTKFLFEIITRPMVLALRSEGFDTTFLQTAPTEGILVYVKVVLVFALMLSGPYVLYQLWSFVGAGLYKYEKQWIYRLLPTSIALFIGGVCFMYFFVLPVCLKFLIGFAAWLPAPSTDFMLPWEGPLLGLHSSAPTTEPAAPPLGIPFLEHDPPEPAPRSVWFDRRHEQLKIQGDGPHERWVVDTTRAGSRGLLTPHFKIDEYLSFVLIMTIAFGAAFQLPLVVIFLVRSGIMTADQLAKQRRVVILVIVIIAGILAPPDISSHLMLSVPMLLLFEIGLLIARRRPRKTAPAAPTPPTM